MKHPKLSALLVALAGIASTSSVFAATNCEGTIKFALKFPTQCDGRLAYNLNDGSEKFFCTSDNTEAALVLTAQASGAPLIVRLADSSLNACTENTVQYTTPRYMILQTPEA